MAELTAMWMNLGEHSCFPGMRRGKAAPRDASAGSCASGRRTLLGGLHTSRVGCHGSGCESSPPGTSATSPRTKMAGQVRAASIAKLQRHMASHLERCSCVTHTSHRTRRTAAVAGTDRARASLSACAFHFCSPIRPDPRRPARVRMAAEVRRRRARLYASQSDGL